MLVFPIIFDVYDIYGAEVSDRYFHIHFHLTAIREVDEMYDN